MLMLVLLLMMFGVECRSLAVKISENFGGRSSRSGCAIPRGDVEKKLLMLTCEIHYNTLYR